MYPSILMFSPSLAKEILSYRIHVEKANEINAKLFNTSGWRFYFVSKTKITLKFTKNLN